MITYSYMAQIKTPDDVYALTGDLSSKSDLTEQAAASVVLQLFARDHGFEPQQCSVELFTALRTGD